jgi:hypothetical protein
MVSQSGEDSFKSKVKFKYLLVNSITTSSVKMLPRTNTISSGKSQFPAICKLKLGKSDFPVLSFSYGRCINLCTKLHLLIPCLQHPSSDSRKGF